MTAALVIFAKQPVPGKVKMRLAEHCGKKTAAEIASVLLTETIKLSAQAWRGPQILYCWPDSDYNLFRLLADEYKLGLATQCPGSLGDKMYAALLNESKRHGCAAIFGADIPHCPKHVLKQGFEWLLEGKSVIGPASDGGYYFLGLQKPEKRIFENLDWGSATVFSDTLNRANEIGISFNRLPIMQDIDNWQDLIDISHQLPSLKKYAGN